MLNIAITCTDEDIRLPMNYGSLARFSSQILNAWYWSECI